MDRGCTVETRARGKSGHGILDRRSASSHVAFAPFGGYAVSVRAHRSGRGRRARRDSRGSSPPPSPEREEERSSGEAAESESGSRGMVPRSLMGTYAASTALAVQESLPPEGVIVLLACLVGVLTGGSVVLFNLAVRCRCSVPSSLFSFLAMLIDVAVNCSRMSAMLFRLSE